MHGKKSVPVKVKTVEQLASATRLLNPSVLNRQEKVAMNGGRVFVPNEVKVTRAGVFRRSRVQTSGKVYGPGESPESGADGQTAKMEAVRPGTSLLGRFVMRRLIGKPSRRNVQASFSPV